MTAKKSIISSVRGIKPRHYEFLNNTDNILLTTLKGPIDLATVRSATEITVRCFAQLGHCNIGCIFVVENSMHITADALEYFSQSLQQHKENLDKKVYVAYVVAADLQGRAVSCALLDEVYGKHRIPYQSFVLLEDARSWLSSVLTPEPAR